VVLRTDNDLLYPRLEKRGYSENKIQENVECEIMCVVAEDARQSYREEILWELPSNTVEEMDDNVRRISLQLQQWCVAA
jgi:adenylate kinase